MKRGLIIGKFMPLHKGHLALIDFAAAQCDELIVSMTYRQDDPIPGPLRFEWIREELANYAGVRLEISPDDFDNETLPWDQRIPFWASFLKKRFPQVHVIFSSENYGDLLAKNLGIFHVGFDPERKKFPVSATLIRQQPFHYWDFIVHAARSFFVKRICLYGPESTGKSTMAKRLAEIYDTEFVPEISREFISSNNFTLADIIRIGHAQTKRVISTAKNANKLLFCDTDLITTQIYCRHYLHTIPHVLLALEEQVKYDRYYLFDVDVPWVADGLRDLGERRLEMFTVFKVELKKRKIPYTVVSGSHDQREKFLCAEMDGLLMG